MPCSRDAMKEQLFVVRTPPAIVVILTKFQNGSQKQELDVARLSQGLQRGMGYGYGIGRRRRKVVDVWKIGL